MSRRASWTRPSTRCPRADAPTARRVRRTIHAKRMSSQIAPATRACSASEWRGASARSACASVARAVSASSVVARGSRSGLASLGNRSFVAEGRVISLSEPRTWNTRVEPGRMVCPPGGVIRVAGPTVSDRAALHSPCTGSPLDCDPDARPGVGRESELVHNEEDSAPAPASGSPRRSRATRLSPREAPAPALPKAGAMPVIPSDRRLTSRRWGFGRIDRR